jgi:hypothetical protein
MAIPIFTILATAAKTVLASPITYQVGGAVLGARSQYVAGKTQEIELKRQAEEERMAAQSRELQRREELNRALAANVVGQAMSGISGEGTPASISLASAKKASLSEGTISLSERLKQAQLKRAASEAGKYGLAQVGSTLLKSGVDLAQTGGLGELGSKIKGAFKSGGKT